MDHTTYKQTRDDTFVRKQIAASSFLRATDSRKRRRYNQGQERTLKPAFFYAKSKLFGIKHNYVRYGVLGGVYPLTSVFVRTSTLLANMFPSLDTTCCSKCDACKDNAIGCKLNLDIQIQCLRRQCHVYTLVMLTKTI